MLLLVLWLFIKVVINFRLLFKNSMMLQLRWLFYYGTHTDVYRGAIEAARAAFDAAAQLGMPPMRVLDIGGGFMPDATFDEAAEAIGDALAQHFPPGCGVEVIGEPGQYFAEKAFTLAALVIGRRARGEARED